MWKQRRPCTGWRHWLGVDMEASAGVNVASRVSIMGSWSMCALTWLVNLHVNAVGQCAHFGHGWSMCALMWLVNVHVDAAGRHQHWCGQSMWSLTRLIEHAWANLGQHGHWPVGGKVSQGELDTEFCHIPCGPPSARVSLCYLWPLCCCLWPPKISPHRWKMCKVRVTWQSSDEL